MNKQLPKILLSLSVTALALAALATDDSDQAEFPVITAQPTDQAVPAGGSAVISVQATNADSFQWLCNGVAIDGQTNSSLTLDNVSTNDAGYYACAVVKDGEVVPTRAASLNVYVQAAGDQFYVYAVPVKTSGSQGTCPGSYAGYVTYTKTVSQGWGWAPSTNTTVHTASDGTARPDTKIVYNGKSMDTGCAQTTVTVPDPPYSSKYRFTIYFPNNVPTNSYPIVLSGFNP